MNEDFNKLFDRAGARHGHLCPSLCLGVRGALVAQKAARKRGMENGSVLLEAVSKCIKDGVMTVLGEDRVIFANTPGACRLTWKSSKEEIKITVRKDIRLKLGELKNDLEPDTEKFQNEGIVLLSQLSDENLFQVE